MTDTNSTTTTSIEEQFKTIYAGISDINGNAKELQLKVKDLAKGFKHACKPRKVKKHTVMHDPMNITPELLKYLGHSSGTQLTKAEAMKQVSGRVKTDKLQDESNRRQFKPNKQLGKVLNMTPIKTITFVELNKYLAHHFTPPPPVVTSD
jgi:chromatin remodeling complex protein RSC6